MRRLVSSSVPAATDAGATVPVRVPSVVAPPDREPDAAGGDVGAADVPPAGAGLVEVVPADR